MIAKVVLNHSGQNGRRWLCDAVGGCGGGVDDDDNGGGGGVDVERLQRHSISHPKLMQTPDVFMGVAIVG